VSNCCCFVGYSWKLRFKIFSFDNFASMNLLLLLQFYVDYHVGSVSGEERYTDVKYLRHDASFLNKMCGR